MGVTAHHSSPVPVVNSAGCGDGSLPCYSESESSIFQPKITRIMPIVYWDRYQPSVSNSSTSMDFWGNCYRIELRIMISGPTEISRDLPVAEDCPSFLLTNHRVSPPGQPVGVNGSCGHVANLSGVHHAYSRFFLEYKGLTQLQTTATGSDVEAQPACCPKSPVEAPYSIDAETYPVAAVCNDGGGGGGGTTTIRCYTMTIDHYWYYPGTGTYEYRYSEDTTWCEESSE